MKAKELRQIAREELMLKLKELKHELIKQRAQIAAGTIPKSPGQIKEIRRTIARILTIIKENKDKEKKDRENKNKKENKETKEKHAKAEHAQTKPAKAKKQMEG